MAVDESKTESLGDRIKKYEKTSIIPVDKPYIVRLDGKNFSKFTNGMKKPFDKNFLTAMVKTLSDLFEFSHANTGFCCSDEISLIFNKVCESKDDNPKNKTHYYNGRYNKINSIFASYCSVRFNHHIIEEMNKDKDNYNDNFINKINSGIALFDSRIIVCDKEEDILNHMLWRSVYDCHRNCVSTFGRYYLGKKMLLIKIVKNKLN